MELRDDAHDMIRNIRIPNFTVDLVDHLVEVENNVRCNSHE